MGSLDPRSLRDSKVKRRPWNRSPRGHQRVSPTKRASRKVWPPCLVESESPHLSQCSAWRLLPNSRQGIRGCPPSPPMPCTHNLLCLGRPGTPTRPPSVLPDPSSAGTPKPRTTTSPSQTGPPQPMVSIQPKTFLITPTRPLP